MACRALAFSDDEIIRLVREEYVAVTCDDWYQRRRRDAEGDFFRRLGEQRPDKPAEGATRQGLYCLTASGRLLAYRNHQEADSVRDMLQQALFAWDRLPERERRPGAVAVPDPGKVDRAFAPLPPPGGLVVNVFTRILDRGRDGGYVRGSCSSPGGELAARDHLWLKRAEWRSLVPDDAKPGDRFPMPPAVADRLLRYHLLDNTRGEPPFWQARDVRKKFLRWTVLESNDRELRLRLEGSVLLATDDNPARAERGYEARLFGTLHYDRARKVLDRLDVVAVGEHWGEGEVTPGARPGRQPLGVAFELSDRKRPADAIPPQGLKEGEDYLPRDEDK